MNHRPHNRARAQEQGFTLVVIAALFIAFAVVASVAIERNSTVQQITRRDATAAQLTRLANAILEYSTFNASGGFNLYPCPAELATPVDLASGANSRFGAEVNADAPYPRVCSDATNDSGGFTEGSYLRVLGTDVIRGMVPVLALSPYGIAPADALDPWNNRIMYVVNRKLTKGSASASKISTITITDKRTGYGGGGIIATPDFILISYGRDGVGGHKVGTNSNTTASIACATASTDLPYENCDNDLAFFVAPTYTAPNAGTGDYFDDILTWYRQ